MPFRIKVSLFILLALALLLAVGPLLVPVPPLTDTVPPQRLADADSRFVEVAGLDVHLKTAGDPATAEGPVFVLLHGFGSSLYSWREVLDELGALGGAVAFDRPGFGLTERPLRGSWAAGANPYRPEAQVELTRRLMDELGIERAVLVGNSSGGAVAADLALAHPERVAGLVLVNAAIYRTGGAPAWSRPLLYTPQLDRVGPLLMRQLGGEPGENFVRASWSDPEAVPDEALELYRKGLRAPHWDEALWELSRASRPPAVLNRLDELTPPTLVLGGRADTVVPPELAEQLAGEVPGARLTMLESCGHALQEECPEALLEALRAWLLDTGLGDTGLGDSGG